jgi:hypothetical protein
LVYCTGQEASLALLSGWKSLMMLEHFDIILVSAACKHCHGTKCPPLTVVFSLSFFSLPRLLLSKEGVIVGFRNFAWGNKSQKKYDWRWKKDSPLPPGGSIFKDLL